MSSYEAPVGYCSMYSRNSTGAAIDNMKSDHLLSVTIYQQPARCGWDLSRAGCTHECQQHRLPSPTVEGPDLVLCPLPPVPSLLHTGDAQPSQHCYQVWRCEKQGTLDEEHPEHQRNRLFHNPPPWLPPCSSAALISTQSSNFKIPE